MITDSMGEFHLPDQPPDRGFRIFVQCDAGYADISPKDLARSPQVVLEPWARVEGTYLVGTKPQPGAPILALAGWMNQNRKDPGTYIRWTYETKTDANGRFVFDRMQSRHYCYVQPKGDSNRSSQSVLVRLVPGGSAQAVIGGQGRTVMGRVTLPDGPRPELSSFYIEVNTDRTHFIKLPREKQTRDHDRNFEEWLKTEEGWKDYSTRQSYSMPMPSNGQFRINDVLPGQYRMHIHSGSDKRQGTITFTVPEIPGGRSDEELDIGTVPL